MSMIQISKRQKGTSKLVDVLIRIGAIVLSLIFIGIVLAIMGYDCLLYTSPSPRD